MFVWQVKQLKEEEDLNVYTHSTIILQNMLVHTDVMLNKYYRDGNPINTLSILNALLELGPPC